MTVSYFAALESRIPAVQAERSLQLAQAALYPHTSKDAAQRMWQVWTRAANPPPPTSGKQAAGSQFYLNDRPVSIFELRRGLGQALGAGLTA
jgi:hypothetical protein